nr:MAG TPA: hypothetical protein [Caudoviricetes sp.]
MSKHITLPSTVTMTTLALTKSLSSKPVSTSPVITYITPATVKPHISKVICTLKASSTPATMLPYLVGYKIALRGTHHKYVCVHSVKIPTSLLIVSTTSTGIITYTGMSYSGGYAHYPVHVFPYTSTTTLTGLIKMLKSGMYTLLP